MVADIAIPYCLDDNVIGDLVDHKPILSQRQDASPKLWKLRPIQRSRGYRERHNPHFLEISINGYDFARKVAPQVLHESAPCNDVYLSPTWIACSDTRHLRRSCYHVRHLKNSICLHAHPTPRIRAGTHRESARRQGSHTLTRSALAERAARRTIQHGACARLWPAHQIASSSLHLLVVAARGQVPRLHHTALPVNPRAPLLSTECDAPS